MHHYGSSYSQPTGSSYAPYGASERENRGHDANVGSESDGEDNEHSA